MLLLMIESQRITAMSDGRRPCQLGAFQVRAKKAAGNLSPAEIAINGPVGSQGVGVVGFVCPLFVFITEGSR